MSLLRLLSAGKSLVGLQAPTSRYRLNKHRMLPEFGGKKEPFRTTVRAGMAIDLPGASDRTQPAEHASEAAKPDQIERGAAAKIQPAAESSAVGPLKAIIANTQPTSQESAGLTAKSVTQVEAKASGRRSQKSAALARSMAWAAGCLGKVRSMAPWGRATAGRKIRMIPRLSPMVQGELSLDSVKVVRNDLSDTDLEIVASRRGAAARNPFARKENEPVTARPPAPSEPGPVRAEASGNNRR